MIHLDRWLLSHHQSLSHKTIALWPWDVPDYRLMGLNKWGRRLGTRTHRHYLVPSSLHVDEQAKVKHKLIWVMSFNDLCYIATNPSSSPYIWAANTQNPDIRILPTRSKRQWVRQDTERLQSARLQQPLVISSSISLVLFCMYSPALTESTLSSLYGASLEWLR